MKLGSLGRFGGISPFFYHIDSNFALNHTHTDRLALNHLCHLLYASYDACKRLLLGPVT